MKGTNSIAKDVWPSCVHVMHCWCQQFITPLTHMHRHNELWGKKAPSRQHPLEMSRKLFHSEPSLQDCGVESSTEPELSFLPEEDAPFASYDPLHTSLSQFPPDTAFPIDKQEHIRNFLASLPPPVAVVVDDDQGIGDVPYTSESGSGYSTPNLSPTDDEHFNLKVQKLSRRAQSDSMMGTRGTDKEVENNKEIKLEGEESSNVCMDAPPPLKHFPLEAKVSDPEIRVSTIDQIPFTIKTIGRESVSVPCSVEPSSLSPNPSSNRSICSQPPKMEEVDFEQLVFRLGSAEPEVIAEETTEQSPQIQSVPERVKEIEKLRDSNLEISKMIVPASIISRNSSVHSQLSSCDPELVQLEGAMTTESSLPPLPGTRHESLSPSPPTKRITEHVRHSSFPSNEEAVKYDSEDGGLGPALHGAVRARILNIEEKKEQDSVTCKNTSNSDVSMRSTSPPTRLKSEQLPRPASVAVDDLTAKPHPSPEANDHTHLPRRESTPPAVFSAWSNMISEKESPPLPVQDLKRKFEDSRSEGGALRRSQSLRTVDPPRRISRGPRTSSPEQKRS